MVVMILEKVPTAIRGELSRWLMEVGPGVFLGHVSALVRYALFERCSQGRREGGVMMVYPAQTEQGFRVRSAGTLSREVVEVEGLYLARRQRKVRAEGGGFVPF
jgi:CRISPR-associated protein Cas2